VCFALTCRGAKILGPSIGLSTGLLAGDDGALTVLASKAIVSDVATLAMLETEEMDG